MVADTGAALEGMTRSVSMLPGANIIRYCHGGASIAHALVRFAPDLVLVDEMHRPKLALRRIDEIRELLPHARFVVRAEQPQARWLADALRAGVSAVVPATAGPELLGVVLAEVVGEQELEAGAHPARLAAA
jgi:DNA-binding NarL/FixJ family response regulator